MQYWDSKWLFLPGLKSKINRFIELTQKLGKNIGRILEKFGGSYILLKWICRHKVSEAFTLTELSFQKAEMFPAEINEMVYS